MTLKANQCEKLGLKPGKQGSYVIITEPKSGTRFTVAKKMAPQFQGFILEFSQHVKFNRGECGSYNFRYIRGSTTTLSTHSFGNAIDINASLNPLSAPHSNFGKLKDSEVIALGEKWGLLCGGAYRNRKDWQHFEGSIYIPQDKLPHPVDETSTEEVEVEELPLITGDDME
jgi:hypothetical protein